MRVSNAHVLFVAHETNVWGNDFCNKLRKPAAAAGTGIASPHEESQYQTVDDKRLNQLCLPLLICHKTDAVSAIDFDTSTRVPGNGHLLVFTVTFNFQVGGHLHWKVALLWQPLDTPSELLGVVSDWQLVARILRTEKVRILIGHIHNTNDHPIIKCMNETMQLTIMQVKGNPNHGAIILGKVGKIIGEHSTSQAHNEFKEYETDLWPTIHTLRWINGASKPFTCAFCAFQLGSAHDTN